MEWVSRNRWAVSRGLALSLCLGSLAASASAQELARALEKELRLGEQVKSFRMQVQRPPEDLEKAHRDIQEKRRALENTFRNKLLRRDLRALKAELSAGLNTAYYRDQNLGRLMRSTAKLDPNEGFVRETFFRLRRPGWERASIDLAIDEKAWDLLDLKGGDAALEVLRGGSLRLAKQLLLDGNRLPASVVQEKRDVLRRLFILCPLPGDALPMESLLSEALRFEVMERFRQILECTGGDNIDLRLWQGAVAKDCAPCIEIWLGLGSTGEKEALLLAKKALEEGADQVADLLVGKRVPAMDVAQEILENQKTRYASMLLPEATGLNARNEEGKTELMRAVSQGSFSSLIYLMAGADPNLRLSDGRTALDLAAEYGNWRYLWALRTYGASATKYEGQLPGIYWNTQQFNSQKVHQPSLALEFYVTAPAGLQLRFREKEVKYHVRDRRPVDPITTFSGSFDDGFDVKIKRYNESSYLSKIRQVTLGEKPPTFASEVREEDPKQWVRFHSRVKLRPDPGVVSVTIDGYRGCYRFVVQVDTLEILAPEGAELARRLFASIDPPPC